jgi:bromodomain-containing factor 1
MRTLRKQRESFPFLLPVDPVALNIPTYFDHIKQPMDIGTVDKKLKAGKYGSADEWIADVRLIFWNCYRFNGQPGPSAPVSISAKAVEDVFEKQLGKLPKVRCRAAETEHSLIRTQIKPPKPAPPPKPAARPPPSPMRDPSPSVKRRPSNALPTIRRTSNGGGDRDKRTIRAPQPYEPDYDDGPLSARPRKSGRQTEQMRYCREVLRELTKKGNEAFTFPFLHPVDWVTLNIPDYPRIVKRPMDLSTVRKKYDAGEYQTPDDFSDDIRLILKNCFIYNPPGTPVHEMGRKVEQLFDSKMLGMPEPGEFDDDSFGEEGTRDDVSHMYTSDNDAQPLATTRSDRWRCSSTRCARTSPSSKARSSAPAPTGSATRSTAARARPLLSRPVRVLRPSTPVADHLRAPRLRTRCTPMARIGKRRRPSRSRLARHPSTRFLSR